MNKLSFKKHTLSLLTLMSILSLTILSCGGGDDEETATAEAPRTATTSQSASTESTEDAEPLFLNQAELEAAQSKLQNLDPYKGHDIKVFQQYYVHKESIEIQLQDPNKPENVDQLEYENGEWSAPEPVQIVGDGDMSANVFSLSEMPFAGAVKVAKIWNEEAKKIGDEVTNELRAVMVDMMGTGLRWNTNNIETARAEYSIYFNQDGSLDKVEKN